MKPPPAMQVEPSAKCTPQKETSKTPPVRTRRSSGLTSPPKANSRRTSTPLSLNSNDANELQACYVCQVSGTAQDLVKWVLLSKQYSCDTSNRNSQIVFFFQMWWMQKELSFPMPRPTIEKDTETTGLFLALRWLRSDGVYPYKAFSLYTLCITSI